VVRRDLTRKELALAVERAELIGTRGIVEHARAGYAALAADALEIAGGVAVFTGVDSPLTEAGGVGIFEPITDETVPALTSFYSAHNAVPRVMVGPMSDPELAFALARASYVPIEHQNVLAIDLETAPDALDPRIREAADVRVWVEASMRGFGSDSPSEILRMTVEALGSDPGVVALEAVDDGEVVATAGLSCTSEIPVLFGASTLPAFRGRGWQSALIRDRLTRARRAGALRARANARPLSQSEMNFVRMGFEVLYTRVLWEWRPKP
jgi:GNAT superfamily N-acetyltransferase